MSVGEAFTPTGGGVIPSNGAIVVAARQVSIDTWVVLAIANPDSPVAEYVTWLVDNTGVAYSGRYFRTEIENAVNDYIERG